MFSYLCRHLIDVQDIITVLSKWLAPQVQKTEKSAGILARDGYSVKSFTMQWTSVIPIQVSEYNDPLYLSHCQP